MKKINFFKNNFLAKSNSFINPYSMSKFIKNPFKCFKNSTNTNKIKISNNFPTDEENLGNLIKELDGRLINNNKIPKNETKEEMDNYNTLTNYVVQKDDIINISNFQDEPILANIKMGQFIIINNSICAQCISIKNNLLTFLLANKTR
jgi:hypothetical protein